MKTKHIAATAIAAIFLATCGSQSSKSLSEPALKDAVNGRFLMGVAVNVNQTKEKDNPEAEIVKRHFNAIVAENCMKMEEIQPQEGVFTFDNADAFVRFGEENGMTMTGHCLIWHSQCPRWFCTDKDGKNVSPEVLKERMKNHIFTLVQRYKGKLKGWDVVNEAIMEDGSYRKSKFYEILGEEFIPLAFQYAHEADPDIELYYNDYSMSAEGKRNAVVKLVRQLKERGIRIDAVGMQGHMGMNHPDIAEFEKSMLAFAAEGVKVMITEWDMSALPTVHQGANISDTVAFRASFNPYPDELPDSVSQIWNDRMKTFFQLFEKHADFVSRVTVWGVSDGSSWLNNFPVRGRKDYSLLFDRNFQPKAFVKELIENAGK